MPILAQQNCPLDSQHMTDMPKDKRNPFGEEPSRDKKNTNYSNFFGPSLNEIYKDMSTTE